MADRMEHVVGGKFKLGKKIRSGSFGKLYLAVNVQNGEEVAVKLGGSKVFFHLLVVHRTSRFVHVVPQVSSRSLKKAIGFKTHVRYCDALMVLKSWIMSKVPFRSSIPSKLSKC